MDKSRRGFFKLASLVSGGVATCVAAPAIGAVTAVSLMQKKRVSAIQKPQDSGKLKNYGGEWYIKQNIEVPVLTIAVNEDKFTTYEFVEDEPGKYSLLFTKKEEI